MTLFGKRVFADIIKDPDVRSCWIIWVDPKSNDKCPLRDKGETQREVPVKTDTEMGVMQPQAKECMEPPEAGRGEEGFSSRVFRWRTSLLIP